MKVDYERYRELLQNHLDRMWYDDDDPDSLEIGENISDCSEIKIQFDGFGDLETEDENGEYVYEEQGNKNMRSFCIFIHKTSATKDFPPHDLTPWALIHRPKEEVHIWVWRDVESDDWEFVFNDTSKGEFTHYKALQILEKLDKKYWSE